MFRELVELGKELEAKGKLLPVGFSSYGEPIRWVVHLWRDRVFIEASELKGDRPSCGRTSGVEAHLLADEAAYALGVHRGPNKEDTRAGEKHAAFCKLLERFLSSQLTDPHLIEAVETLQRHLKSNVVRHDLRYGEINPKDWVSFVWEEEGPLKGKHLFRHPDALAFWVKEMEVRSSPEKVLTGECAVCGEFQPLVGKIPLKVKLEERMPIHSLNQDAFVSYFNDGKEGVFKRAHIGLCFRCGDTAARAFNFLSDHPMHHKTLIRSGESGKLSNQTALFWVKAPAPIVDESTGNEIDLEEFVSSVLVESSSSSPSLPKPKLNQVLRLFEVPWKPADPAHRLDDYSFYVAILSPNIGRIALREWITASLTHVKENLRRYLTTIRTTLSRGDEEFLPTIANFAEALENKNPNFTRTLLRTAYLGFPPPQGLIQAAVRRIRVPNVIQERGDGFFERFHRLPSLIAAIRLALYYGKEPNEMDTQDAAYLCGRLLALLERAQQQAHDFQLNTTVVDRFYGSASTAPASVFSGLIRTATTAHLPKAGRINILFEEIMKSLDEAGGFPKTLNAEQQGQFALGFYAQRAELRKQSPHNESPTE